MLHTCIVYLKIVLPSILLARLRCVSIVEVILLIERGWGVSHANSSVSVLTGSDGSLVHLIVVVKHGCRLVSLAISLMTA